MTSKSTRKDVDGLNLEGNPLIIKETSENVHLSMNKSGYNMAAEPYTQALDSIDDEFSSKSTFALRGHSCHGESSDFVESDRLSIGDPINLTKNTNILDSSVKDSCEVTINTDLLLKNQIVKYERKDESTSPEDIDQCKLFFEDTNTSAKKKSMSEVEATQQCKGIKTLRSNSVLKINKQVNIKTRKYPPISVRKISCISSDEASKMDHNTKLNTCAGFRKMNSQHSAQCIKQGQMKCDFVCSLYKSKDWTMVSEVDKQVCNFCKGLFGWEGLTCLNLDKPLPSSFIDPITLLRYYGFMFSFPNHPTSEQSNSTLVNICQKCYDLVLDGDVAYKKLHNTADQMMQLWPKEAVETASFPLDKRFPENHAKSQDFNKFEMRTSVNETKVYSTRKYPLILPRKEGSKFIARNSITSDVSFNPMPKYKKDYEKSNRVRSKPLTCGFCGKDYYLENQWEQHLEEYHRVQQRWLKFTPNMHNKLRTLIINELIKTGGHEKGNSSKVSKSISFLCSACSNSFSSETKFILHLREHHNITIDDALLPDEDHVIQCSHNERKQNITFQSNDIPGVQDIFSNGKFKEELHPTESKRKCLIGNDEDVAKVMDLVEYESKNMTDEDSILNNTLGQITEVSYANKDFVDNEYCCKKNGDRKQEVKINACDVVCQICSLQLSSKRDLEKHIESTHLTSVVIKGDGKGGVLDFNIDHQGSNKYVKKEVNSECPESDVSRMIENSSWHQKDGDIIESCSFSLYKESLVKSSDRNARVPHRLLYECKICCRRITGKKLLYNHLRKIHNISMNLNEESYYCKFCLFRSTDRALLIKHKREKHGNIKGTSQRQCETCGKIYSSAYIQEHVAVVHGDDRKYTCDFCGMKFFNKKSVKSHIYYEHANKHWKCEKCDLTFKKYHQLRQHTTYVHSNKEFKCDKCSKVFKRKGDLTEHKKRSHQQVNLICNFCSRQYRNAHKFKAHLINVHGVSKEDTYSQQYARHKRANNRLNGTVNDIQLDESLVTKEKMESQIIMNNTDDVAIDQQLNSSLEDHTTSVKNSQEPEFQFVEVSETTNNDMEMEEVTLLIYV